MGSISSHETYLSINADRNDGKHYFATFTSIPFAEGSGRLAFKGVLQGDGRRNNSTCVTKVFKSGYAKNFLDWAPDLAASKKAFGFAEYFAQKYIRGHELVFVIPLIAKMQNISCFNLLWLFPILEDERFITTNGLVAIEPYIPGHYQKFNSNSGYEDSTGIHDLMTAFCHWTWNVSGHNYMVCDLQGVKAGKKYILTDPAIHSADRAFGPTDLGVEGMERVLGNHRCNKLCRDLGLNNPMTGVQVNAGQRSTTYSFQVTEEALLRGKRESKHFRFETDLTIAK